MEKVICIIPARYGSTRFPGKVIAKIFGKPMVQYVWEKAIKSKFIDRTIIATDDKRIFNEALNFGAEVVITSKNCNSGTDRVAEVISTKKLNCDLVVNLQADEPLIHPQTIDRTIKALIDDRQAVVSTPAVKIAEKNDLNNTNIVKVVFDKEFYALYFSRSLIPFYPSAICNLQSAIYYKHIGLYVYRSKFLKTFVKSPHSKLEKVERLEQLRILENGYKIKVVPVSRDTIAVDTSEDLKRVIKKLKN